MIRAYLFFGIIVLASAQIPSLGFCPDYLPMADFDIDNFLGKWYESERYFQFADIVSRCVVTDYAKGPNGKIYVSNEVTNRLTGIKRVIDGHLELAGRVGEGKLNVKYSTTPLSSQATLAVLDTDYDNYAVIWSCSGFGPLSAQSAWVMTRERLPSVSVMQTVYGVLDNFKISRTFFVKTDQEGCALAASEINAANGITGQSTIPHATGQPQRKVPLTGIFGDAQQINESPEAVKLVESNPGDDKPVPVNPEAALETAKVKEILPEAVNADPINAEEISSGTVNSVAAPAANIISEAVKSVAESSEAANANIKDEIVNLIPNKSEPDNELKPIHVAEIILENNSVQQSEPVPVVKADIKPVEDVPDKSPAPVERPAEEVYVPLKTAIEDKVSITKGKTN